MGDVVFLFRNDDSLYDLSNSLFYLVH